MIRDTKSYQSSLWMKIAYVGGSVFFGSLSSILLWVICQAAQRGQVWAAPFLVLPFSLFLYGTYLGIRLIQYMNLAIAVGSHGLVLIKGNQSVEYRWQEVRIKTSGIWQVMHCYDGQGRVLFTVDYIFPENKSMMRRVPTNLPIAESTRSERAARVQNG